MFLKCVRCDRESFKEVHFTPGFNVILAERTKESQDKDSRNGLGKSLLIEIIHFCLGASTAKNKGLRAKELEDWTFILDLSLGGKDYTIYRNTLKFSKIKIEGDVSQWPIKPDAEPGEEKYILSEKDWRLVLGELVFGIPVDETGKKYSPTFRSMISYFMRRGVAGFQSPFKHYPNQKEWDIQVNNARLLGLGWEYASDLQVLKDKERTLAELKKAAGQGLLTGYVGSIGELEAERVTLAEDLSRLQSQLASFKVHPQYYKIQEEVNRLTKEIHDIANSNTVNRQILEKYRESIVREKTVPVDKVQRVYQEAGFVFAEGLKKKLDSVEDFHRQLITNRKEYLQSEIQRLSREIEEQEKNMERLSNRRAEGMTVLQTHGALEEHAKLQERAAGLRQQLEEVRNRLENLKRFEEGKSRLKIEKEELFQAGRRDFDERMPLRNRAIRYFNYFSDAMYSESGRLSLDVTESGYKFGVEIKRAGSQGIGYMKVFCYDLTLLRLFSELTGFVGCLVHDSTVFDGVDERQVAKALELSAAEAGEQGTQYICALNSDNVPFHDFTEGFRERFEKSVVITFTDATDDGGLLGVRY